MPSDGRRIMKLDPKNNDEISSVGDDLGGNRRKYIGTVVGIDGCVYGLPDHSFRIIKYDPNNGVTSYVGYNAHERVECYGGGALGRDECIYAVSRNDQILKIDTRNNSHSFSGDS